MWQKGVQSVSRTPPAVAGAGMHELLGAKRAFTDSLQENRRPQSHICKELNLATNSVRLVVGSPPEPPERNTVLPIP